MDALWKQKKRYSVISKYNNLQLLLHQPSLRLPNDDSARPGIAIEIAGHLGSKAGHDGGLCGHWNRFLTDLKNKKVLN